MNQPELFIDMAKTTTARARVLSAHPAVGAIANDILEGDAAAIAELAEAGMVDANPAAVAYAQGLEGSRVIQLTDPAAATEVAAALTEQAATATPVNAAATPAAQ